MSMGIVFGVITLAGLGWFLWERSQRHTSPVTGGIHNEIELPHEQEFELYHNDFSLCAKKVRVCLAELGLPHKSHHIDLIETGSYQTLSRGYLKVNPSGVVPTLVHKGHPIYESHDIIRYAADHSPAQNVKLVPDDPEEREKMQHWIDFASLVGDNVFSNLEHAAGSCVPGLTMPIFAAMMKDISTWRVLEGLLFHRLRARPLMFLTLKLTGLKRIHRRGPFIGLYRRSARQMDLHLDALEAELERSGGPWLLGRDYSLADVGMVVIFERMLEADCLERFLGAGCHSKVRDYWERLRQRPSYQQALAQHVHPTVGRGLERLRAAKRADPELRAALDGS